MAYYCTTLSSKVQHPRCSRIPLQQPAAIVSAPQSKRIVPALSPGTIWLLTWQHKYVHQRHCIPLIYNLYKIIYVYIYIYIYIKYIVINVHSPFSVLEWWCFKLEMGHSRPVSHTPVYRATYLYIAVFLFVHQPSIYIYMYVSMYAIL